MLRLLSLETDSPKVNAEPIELQEIKLQSTQPLIEIKEAIPEKFKLWHVWTQEKILTAIEEKNLDKLNFFVGPAFDPILRQYENEMYVELDKAYFMRNCAEIMQERIYAGIHIFCAIKRNEAMLKDRENKLLEIKASNDIIKLIEGLKKSHTEILVQLKDKGLGAYREWYNQHIRSLQEYAQGTILNLPEYVCIPDYKMDMTDGIKSEMREFLSMWVKPWIKIQIKNDWYINGLTQKEIESEIYKVYENLINSLLDCTNFEALKGKLKEFSMDQKIAVREKLIAFKIKIEEEISRYQKFAKEFLKEGGNRRLVKDFLLSNELGCSGMTENELIEMILEYKFSVMRCYSNEVWLEKMGLALGKIENIELQTKMEAVLEKHCLTPRLKLALKESALVYERLNQTQLAHPTSGNVAKDWVEYNAQVLGKAYSVALKSSIKEPLSEPQLKMMIDRFSCTNQKQVFVKRLLKKYLENDYDTFSRAWVRSFFTSQKSSERRREVEYLISSLYLSATSENASGGIDKDQELEKSVLSGIHLILELINREWKKYNKAEKVFYYSWLSELLNQAKQSQSVDLPTVSESKGNNQPKKSHLVRFSLIQKKPQLLLKSQLSTGKNKQKTVSK